MQSVFNKLCILMCLLVLSAANADPIADIYQVEVIVFEHTDPNRFQSEHWPKFVGKQDIKRAVNLDRLRADVPDSIDTLDTLDALDDAGDKPVSSIINESINLVDPKHFLLNNELRMVKTSKVQRFIRHLAWNQPLANNVKSTPVYFTAGKNHEISTIIAIKPARNIFSVYIDLIYKIQSEDRDVDPGVEEIRIVRDVRMKKKEVYYVDHPVIGMMIIISPVVYGNSSYSPLPNQ